MGGWELESVPGPEPNHRGGPGVSPPLHAGGSYLFTDCFWCWCQCVCILYNVVQSPRSVKSLPWGSDFGE